MGMYSKTVDPVIYRRVLSKMSEVVSASPSELNAQIDGVSLKDIYVSLNKAKKEEYVAEAAGKWNWLGKEIEEDSIETISNSRAVGKGQDVNQYFDWAGVLPKLQRAYRNKIPTLIIGPKGTGKTEGLIDFCRKMGLNLYTVPCSLGLREHEFVGRLDKNADGTITFKEGPLPKSMQDEEGGVLYLDEMSAGEEDVLLRIDEATDARREVNIEDKTIKANDKWWCVASINPLDHAGTKELPPQLSSRFTFRIHLDYPNSLSDEMEIVKKRLGWNDREVSLSVHDNTEQMVDAIRDLREQSGSLFYTPSLRESIAAAMLFEDGSSMREVVECVILGIYFQWGTGTVEKVRDFLISKLGEM